MTLGRPEASREALGAAVDALRAAGVESPRLDAELLLAAATGRERAALVADPARRVSPAGGRLFGEMVRRRLRREPVAYILGRKGFRQIELAVDRRVLVPRPETELLVELALELGPGALLDVGTGSGAIALAVADELPGCEVTATDTSAGGARRRPRQRRAARPRRAGPLPRGDDPGEDCRRTGERLRPGPRQPSLRRRARVGRPCSPRSPNGSPARRCSPAPTASTPTAPSPTPSAQFCRRIAGKSATRHRRGRGSRWGRGRRRRSPSCCGRPGFAEIETRRDLAGIERVVVGRDAAMSESRLDRARRGGGGARGARALHRRRRRRRLPRRRPLRARLRPARRGRDRADPRDQGPRRRQALGGPLLLAAGDAGAARRASARAPRRRPARCCRAR